MFCNRISIKKLQFGPVPDDYEKFLEEFASNSDICYQVKMEGELEKHEITSLKKYDVSIFSEEELSIINQVKLKFKDYSSQKIVDYSHQEKAFTNTKLLEPISYEYAIDLNMN